MKVNTYRWRLITSNVASNMPAPSNFFCQQHHQQLNVLPATSPATRQLSPVMLPATNQQLPVTSPAINKQSPATSPAINQRSPATLPAIKKGLPAINKRSPATQQVIAGNSGCCWRHCWQYGMLLVIALATQGVAGDIAGNTGNRW